ncbi:C40 family peptidase [Flagellimonas zhangzhouensis]|uniref:SH3 domain-containing protein n=1 Tax=Flagellimonas zhangzhouensis TaxID=1073328 RepID=A0A1H2XTT0_9FLAO|nr:C40 family peptidase [Allomuricauda zhangzhouensis]SDQ91448.1 SH3 domain-containing protein [Allomuricauda zhangzhouensis]SDW96200.1 SH3 domain-containing protein [Allomuricauda zhangzhouensis]
MQYGICPLSIVPIRTNPDGCSEMTSQLQYGEHFKILESRKKWSRIRVAYDKFEGWVPNNQITEVPEQVYEDLDALEYSKICSDIISHIYTSDGMLLPILLGSMVNKPELLEHTFEGSVYEGKNPKEALIDTAILYLKAPFLNGGKTPFGIDCSGFTQMVYKINGYTLGRTAEEQSKQGEALSFIEESEPGDLAFFDNNEGVIDHVGIILKDNYIIHVNGHVRIDRIDHTGIFNTDEKLYTHQLRVIKKII